ncbi:MAG: ATP-grasp domain-containing protein [Acidobacteriota bacterium]|nr:ATP-grasp domain-containing protein [Acidobacteriota bacterium]
MLKRILSSPKMPYLVFHIPTLPYIAWLSLKSRTPFFYTACNPITPYHGGDTTLKSEILKHVAPEYLPRTVHVDRNKTAAGAAAEAERAGFQFPMVAKPDLGERGRGVVLVRSVEELAAYLKACPGPVLLQEYLDMPYEIGVLYCRYPGEDKGRINSISLKRMPLITGDGTSTMEELAARDQRMRLFLRKYRKKWGSRMDEVLAEGETFLLDFVAQSGRGTQFLDSRNLINDKVAATFDRILGQVPGFFLGRADLKAESLESLETGEGIRILELNGTASMPLHIWDPGISSAKAYADMFAHWRHIYNIARRNRKLGVRCIGLREALTYLKNHFSNAEANEAIEEPVARAL